MDAGYLSTLDELERVKAEDFLRRARQAAEENWQGVAAGGGGAGAQAPAADVTYTGDIEHSTNSVNDAHDGGGGDVEGSSRRLSAPRLQKELSRLEDCTRVRALEARCTAMETGPK